MINHTMTKRLDDDHRRPSVSATSKCHYRAINQGNTGKVVRAWHGNPPSDSRNTVADFHIPFGILCRFAQAPTISAHSNHSSKPATFLLDGNGICLIESRLFNRQLSLTRKPHSRHSTQLLWQVAPIRRQSWSRTFEKSHGGDFLPSFR